MRVSVVTPDKSYFDGEAQMVSLVAVDGELGILPKHAPLISRLANGVARVEVSQGKVERFAIYGGFVKVQDDVVSVLAGGAATKDEGDSASALKALNEAKTRLESLKGKTGAEFANAQEQLSRAEAFHKLVSTSA